MNTHIHGLCNAPSVYCRRRIRNVLVTVTVTVTVTSYLNKFKSWPSTAVPPKLKSWWRHCFFEECESISRIIVYATNALRICRLENRMCRGRFPLNRTKARSSSCSTERRQLTPDASQLVAEADRVQRIRRRTDPRGSEVKAASSAPWSSATEEAVANRQQVHEIVITRRVGWISLAPLAFERRPTNYR